MIKILKWIVGCMVMVSLTACGTVKETGKEDVIKETLATDQKKQPVDAVSLEEAEGKETAEKGTTEAEGFTRMVKVDDRLFTDTGEISSAKRCGNMDFHFDSSVEQGEPVSNFQTNFGTGYGGQYSIRENRIEILIDDKWHVFAYNENNLDGVSLKVTECTKYSLTMEISNNTDLQVEYGEDYLLEVFDEEIQTWTSVPYKDTEVAFHDIAYVMTKGEPAVLSVDWTSMYGELEEGRYRIVKEVNDSRETGDYTTYTLMDEFEISGSES